MEAEKKEAQIVPLMVLVEMSQDFDEIAKALAAAQAKMTQPEKNRTAKVTARAGGSSYTYGYADLASVLNACKPMADEGIAIVQFPNIRNDQYMETDGEGREFSAWRIYVSVVTKFLHGKQFLANKVEVIANSMAPQDIGKAETYCRRYGLQMLAGLAGEQDDDVGDGSRAKTDPEDGGQPEERPAGPQRASNEAGQNLTTEVIDLKKKQGPQGGWMYQIKIKGVPEWLDCSVKQFEHASTLRGTGLHVKASWTKKASGYLQLVSLNEIPPPGAIYVEAGAAPAGT